MTPDAIKKLAALLAELPSLGPRQASRLAFHIAGLDKATVDELIATLKEIGKVKRCVRCFRLDELSAGRCSICASTKRNQALVAVVEKETDVLTLEKARVFTGRYLVLGELSRDGVPSPEHKRRIAALKQAAAELPSGKLQEVIIAFSPTTYGDVNAVIVSDALKNNAEKITRLARGIPTGGEIEFADEDTLSAALKNRN